MFNSPVILLLVSSANRVPGATHCNVDYRCARTKGSISVRTAFSTFATWR